MTCCNHHARSREEAYNTRNNAAAWLLEKTLLSEEGRWLTMSLLENFTERLTHLFESWDDGIIQPM
jgi:hypothetical protein